MGKKTKIIFHIVIVCVCIGVFGYQAREITKYRYDARQSEARSTELERQLNESLTAVDKLRGNIKQAQESITDSLRGINSIEGLIEAIRKAVYELAEIDITDSP